MPVGPQSHVRNAGEIQRHPNGYYYLVMERMSEKSLQQVLASRQRVLRTMLDYWRRCREHSHYKADMA